MPWKPPSTSDSHDKRWSRISAQKRKGEALCRLCHASGKIVPANVVDHIVPLAEGGTHEQSNLMPLCKRCHDAIKTPADLRARERAARSQMLVLAIALGAEVSEPRKDWRKAKTIDFRIMRRDLAKDVGFQQAHLFMLAAIEGILKARMLGDLPACQMILVQDDAAWTHNVCVKFQVETRIEYTEMLWHSRTTLKPDEIAWLRERFGNEYAARHQEQTKGTQQSSTT